MAQEIVRSAWEHAESGGNDRTADLAWAAGFFDGEGHIGIHRTRIRRHDGQATYGLQLNVAQVDPRPLMKFTSILGGRLKRYQITQGGNRAPYKTVWYAYGSEAARVLDNLLPYLSSKGEQARVALEFQASKGTVARLRASDDELAWQKSMSDRLKALREEVRANS